MKHLLILVASLAMASFSYAQKKNNHKDTVKPVEQSRPPTPPKPAPKNFEELITDKASVQQELLPKLHRLVSDGYKAGIFLIIGTGQTAGRDLPASLLALIDTRVVFRLNAREDYRKFFDTVKVDIPLKQGHFRYRENRRIIKGEGVLFPLPGLEALVAFIAAQRVFKTPLRLPQDIAPDADLYAADPLFADAARIIVQNQMGSTSLLQRRMKLGYNRAGRLMDQMQLAGVVGPNLGDKSREVLIKTERELNEVLESMGQ